MVIDNKYGLKQIVYLITDTDQRARMVVGIKVCMDNTLLYQLACGTDETWHYEAEMSEEKDIVTTM
jgi:hypothetical protein